MLPAAKKWNYCRLQPQGLNCKSHMVDLAQTTLERFKEVDLHCKFSVLQYRALQNPCNRAKIQALNMHTTNLERLKGP